MATSRKKKDSWRTSEAKEQLKLDITAEVVTDDSDPQEVYDSRPELYHEFAFKNFKTNLKSLLKKVANQSTTPSRKKKVSWRKSEAKDQLELDIIAEVVTDDSDPQEVYDSRPELYYEFAFNNFNTNLKSLLKKVANQRSRAAFDAAAVDHDRSAHPFPARNGHGRLQWYDSEAKRLLWKDIDDGVYIPSGPNKTKPIKLWTSRPEYQLFELETFRNHIYQEIKSKKSRCYFKDKSRTWTHG
jgi:hypothetical protein